MLLRTEHTGVGEKGQFYGEEGFQFFFLEKFDFLIFELMSFLNNDVIAGI